MRAIQNAIRGLLNEHDVARITSLSVASVRRWRLLRRGPKYIKVGAAVRYRSEDLAAWLDSRPTGGESTEGGAVTGFGGAPPSQGKPQPEESPHIPEGDKNQAPGDRFDKAARQ